MGLLGVTKMQELSLYNGNGKRYKLPLPKLIWLRGNNDLSPVVVEHIKKNCGIEFKKEYSVYVAYPKSCYQIVRLFLTYNFKTEFHDNATDHNTLYLKSCSSEGFHVNSLCFKCCEHNGIYTGGLNKKVRLGV